VADQGCVLNPVMSVKIVVENDEQTVLRII